MGGRSRSSASPRSTRSGSSSPRRLRSSRAPAVREGDDGRGPRTARRENAMIERIPFGKTGHRGSLAIFGAAARAAMKPERAEQTLELLPRFGVNHIDVAASYGDAELRLAPWLRGRRADYFVATKTQCRTGDRARAELERSLERLE